MVLASGRRGTTTPRDQRIFEALFFCRYLSTKQIADLFFDGKANQARTRLYKLDEKKKGYLKRRSMYVRAPTSFEDRGAREAVWYLTKHAFDMVAATHDHEDIYAPKQLLDEGARHYVLTNEVYAAAAPILDDELGPYPEWEWRHEKRVEYVGEYENEPYFHRPDAHIVFRDHVFIIERQTAESKIGPKALEKKVRDHKRYAELVLKNGNDDYYETEKPCEEVEILFACDDAMVADRTERAGKQHGVRVVGRDVAGIADYLYSSALRLY